MRMTNGPIKSGKLGLLRNFKDQIRFWSGLGQMNRLNPGSGDDMKPEQSAMPNRPRASRRTASSGAAGWKRRHVWVVVLAIVAVLALAESRAEWSAMHRWNRAVGDASVLLLALAMAAGPLTRLRPRARRFLPWRRELGVWGTLLAVIHTLIILDGWLEWDLVRLFGYELHPLLGRYVMLQHGFGLANVVGVAALLYGVVLAISSNDRSQKLLGGSVWKFLQQGAYVLWVLVLTHTAYFLYLHFQDFHRQVPEPNWIQMPFAGLVSLVAALQLVAFWKTWKMKRNGQSYASA
jgi:sulfoxide reductase heme-binding subunit YedZ